MNKQYMINQVCQYVLDQGHEIDNLEDNMRIEAMELFSDFKTLKQIRETLYAQRNNSIWYLAICLADGTKEANKAYRGVVAEAIEFVRDDNLERTGYRL